MAANQTGEIHVNSGSSETISMLDAFWPGALESIQNINISTHFKTQELPLARIKKIMKLDEDVKMISAEAPVLFAKACEIFIAELSLRAWIHTEDNKRRTLQKNDVSQAVAKYDQFDFLIDIVPRDEIKPAKREDNLQRASLMPDQVQYYFQLAQQTQQALQQPGAAQPQQQIQIQNLQQPAASQQQTQQQIQIQTSNGQIVSATPLMAQNAQDGQPQVIQIQAPQQDTQQQQQQVVQQLQQTLQAQQQQQVQPQEEVAGAQEQAGGTQVFQQVVTPSGEVVHMPLQLTQAQLQAIQAQMQGKQPGQPTVIQTNAEQEEQHPQPLFQVPIGGDNQQILVSENEPQEQTIHIKGEH